MKEEVNKKKQFEELLEKRAVGYKTEETVEEFALLDGEVKLTKKKVTVKNVPPDPTALKILLEISSEKPLAEYSDEELLSEKNRLIESLLEQEKLKEKDIDKEEQT